MFFDVDLPRDALFDGAIILQWAQLRAVDISDAPLITFACKVQVSNPDGAEAAFYKGSALFDSNTQSGKTYREANVEEIDQSATVRVLDDLSFYALKESEIDWNNLKQSCMIELDVDKSDRSEVFLTYEVNRGTRIYASVDDTAPKNIGEDFYSMTVTEPERKYKEFDADEGIPDDVETNKRPQAEKEVEVDAADIFGTDGSVKQKVNVNYEAVKDMYLPDMLSFDFVTKLPAGIM